MDMTEEVLSLPLTGSSEADSNSNQNREVQCLQAARQIFSCYRKDDAADPEGYVAAIAALLSEYSREVVELVADPRTGIGRRSKFLPNTADVAEDCDGIKNKIANDAVNADFQKRRHATPRYVPVIIWAPNLFVPSDVKDYDKMVERAGQENPERSMFEKGHRCLDNVRRDGILVPKSWWDERGGATVSFGKFLAEVSKRVLKREYGIDETLAATPALLKTLKNQRAEPYPVFKGEF
jgi:hypothetical protein